jgi:hypothetical protein
VRAAQGKVAASKVVKYSGISTKELAGKVENLVSIPSISQPKLALWLLDVAGPASQKGKKQDATLAPATSPSTPEPTSNTLPAPSDKGTTPFLEG